MKDTKKELTIIVPTRERPDTLFHCLRTICSQHDANIEIIVSDNCGGPQTKEVIDSFQDKRLSYIRPSHRLGMSEHWEFALSHAKGDWVTIIGDDDGLLPGAAKRFFDYIEGKDIEAVSSQTGRFVWPGNDTEGKLIVRTGSGSSVRNSKQWLNKALSASCDFVALPHIYTGGFLHRNVIERIKKLSGGVFFKSIIPDAYSAVAAATITDKYLYIWEPLAIAGISSHSNGKQYMSQVETKKMDFFLENKMSFHPSLGDGRVRSLPVLVYESHLQSAHLRTSPSPALVEQLAISIADADPKDRESVRKYCAEIAQRNDVTIPYGSILAAQLRKKVLKQLTNIGRVIDPRMGAKSLRDSGIRDIYSASIISRRIYNAEDLFDQSFPLDNA